MIRQSLPRLPGASRALVFCLALAAVAFGLAPSIQVVSFADSFESWPGAWTVSSSPTGNQVVAMRPSQDPTQATRAVGAWDGTQAMKVTYGGTAATNRAEAAAAIGGPFQAVALRLMVYVPKGTVASMTSGQEVQIARLMTLVTAPTGPIMLFLVRGPSGLFVRGEYDGGILITPFGSATTTDIAPDTWHTIEVTYDEVGGLGANLRLYVDDLISPRASASGLAVLLGSLNAVAVGLTRSPPASTAQLVWWIDDVAAGPNRIGHGPPRVHFHQDGFEVPNIAVDQAPAGKSLVTPGGNAKQLTDAGHRGHGMVAEDGDSAGNTVSAAYGELGGSDAGAGKVFHRVWWRQGPVTSSSTTHPLTGIGGSSLGGAAPLHNPMAAVSVLQDGTAVLWGYSLNGGSPSRDPDMRSANLPPLGPSWHLVEVEVASAGTAAGMRTAWVDGRLLGRSTASWLGVMPTQWIDGHLPDSINAAYTGHDEYDDSRTSLLPQASQFGLGVTGPVDAGVCTLLPVLALDSNDNPLPAPPAEDVTVAYEAHGAGAFHSDPTCSPATILPGSIVVPSGVTSVPAYFRAPLPGLARVTLSSPDYVTRDTTFIVAGDVTPPTVPGQPVPARTVTNSAVRVEWQGSRDDGGSGLAMYQVEVSENDGGWKPWTVVPAVQPGADAGFNFDAGEAYWRLRVRAFDGDGNGSAASPESPLILVDRTSPDRPPDAPDGVVAPGASTVTVSWTGTTDPGPAASGIASYTLNAEELPGSLPYGCGGPATFCDIMVRPGYTYAVQVTARDNAGNVSAPSPTGSIVYPGPTTSLRMFGPGVSTGPGTSFAAAGVNYRVTVEAVDDNGNVNTGYQGRVVFRAATESGATDVTTAIPLDGGSYLFAPAADWGRHTFNPGFRFGTPGLITASVTDVTASTQLQAQVQVTVIPQGQVTIIHDANSQAMDGVPYLYNEVGAVRAVSSEPVAFTTCPPPAPPPPGGFLVDRASGAVRWIPAQGGNSWTVALCIRASTPGGATDEYTFFVSSLLGPGQGRPVASFLVTPGTTGTGVPALFDPSSSRWDPDLSPPAYRWRFGDGSPLSFLPQPAHRYLLPGGYRPALTLFDAIGQSDQARREVSIRSRSGRLPPTLVIDMPPLLTGDESLETALHTIVTSGDSPAGTVHWDLGNGAFETGASVIGSYRPGRTWATAMVVDDDGLPATDKVEIAVTRSGKVPPFCVAAVDPPVAVIPAAGRAQVDWIGWRSPGSKPLTSVSWSIEGVVSAGGAVPGLYSTAGWRRGVLTVIDEDGLTCTDSVALLVLDAASTAQPTVPPHILDTGVKGAIDCAAEYTGREALASGTGPLSWFISNASQTDLDIDPSTGVVTWGKHAIAGLGQVSYTLVVQGPDASDLASVTIPYTCGDRADLGTRCGCGAAGGGPAFAGLLLLLLRARRSRRR